MRRGRVYGEGSQASERTRSGAFVREERCVANRSLAETVQGVAAASAKVSAANAKVREHNRVELNYYVSVCRLAHWLK